MILDANSNPVTSTPKLIHGADTSRRRGPQFRIQNKSIEDLITERDRDVIISLSMRVASNLGPARSVIDQKASYSVGDAWLPSYKGKDKDKGEEVKGWLNGTFFNSLDVRGDQWDWWENLEQVSREMDVRGDHFTLLTTDETGEFPRIKNIPAYAIKTKGRVDKGKVIDGDYKGNRICYGIIYSKNKQPIAYRVSTGDGIDDYTDIPAKSIIHTCDLWLSDSGRGLPVATHALDELKHILQSTEYESSRQLILSSIGLFVENETGGPDMGDPTNLLSGNTQNYKEGVSAEQISPQIWYAQAGQGEKITQLKHETGGDSFESFHDRMIRSFVAGAGWSYSLTWKPTGQGTAERGEILRARKAIVSRQKKLRKWALRVVTYAYAFANQKGYLPSLENPFSWEFSKPPRLSVDDGREAKMLMEGFRLGKDNMTDLLDFDGRTYDEHLDTRANEALKRKLKIQEIKDNHGVDIDERELVMFTPNEQPTHPATLPETVGFNQPEDQEGDEETNEAVRFENLKSKFDAYGVAVRAGAITPSIQDEEDFRREGGLPPMSKAVKSAWKQDKGFRRPITLVSGSSGPVTATQTTNSQDE